MDKSGRGVAGRGGPVTKVTTPDYVITAEQRAFWSFQRVRKPPVPQVKDSGRVRNPIDNFVFAKLEAQGLKPARPAEKRVLIRRATLDLTGLPPTAEEVDAFLEDPSPNAFAKVVDRLLDSPRYGERWGRYWLDVARYSDDKLNSTQEEPHPNAFRYRDWVIRRVQQRHAVRCLRQGADCRRPCSNPRTRCNICPAWDTTR